MEPDGKDYSISVSASVSDFKFERVLGQSPADDTLTCTFAATYTSQLTSNLEGRPDPYQNLSLQGFFIEGGPPDQDPLLAGDPGDINDASDVDNKGQLFAGAMQWFGIGGEGFFVGRGTDADIPSDQGTEQVFEQPCGTAAHGASLDDFEAVYASDVPITFVFQLDGLLLGSTGFSSFLLLRSGETRFQPAPALREAWRDAGLSLLDGAGSSLL